MAISQSKNCRETKNPIPHEVCYYITPMCMSICYINLVNSWTVKTTDCTTYYSYSHSLANWLLVTFTFRHPTKEEQVQLYTEKARQKRGIIYTHALFTYHPLHNCTVQVSLSGPDHIPWTTIKKEEDHTSWPGRDKSTNKQVFLNQLHAGSKRKRCGLCKGCNSDDCGTCLYCQDKPKFGGPGKKKQCCEQRKCLEMQNKVMKFLCQI